MIRGADPQPGANTTFKGTKLSLYDAAPSSDNTATPGTVLSIDEFGIHVSTSDGNVNIGRVRESGSGKVLSAEWAESVGLGVGDILGT
jgi:methionyl-tRNA formyltransferase